ncbi:hypothetical protein DE146DRAFT_478750 [Phaeosphaeria sp. MPI-PUGE-AT-0046c]|nr:hypothetical protein DE146DRAFT_478750 [Phaeosphaeria sp. MPI-PUGE-AT-0046c]
MILHCPMTVLLLLTVLLTTVLGTIGTGTGGSFTWQVSSSLPSGSNYALEIKQGSEKNYSGQFSLTGTSSGVLSSATGSAAASAFSSVRSTLLSSGAPPAVSSASNPRSSPPVLSSAFASITSSVPSAASSNTIKSSVPPTGSTVSTVSTVSTISTVSTSALASPTSSDTTSGGSDQGGLTTGEKAGIGVGVSVGGLLLALGAFFLGLSARKKSKRGIDTESGSVGGKPELDGKVAYHEKVTPEVESGMIPVDPRRSDDSVVPAPKAFELSGSLGQATVTHRELAAEPRGVEIDSSESQQPRHELYAISPVSPISEPQHTGPARRDTYDDPRLVQNPWAQDEGRPPR